MGTSAAPVTISSAPGADGTWTPVLSVWREQIFDISISGTFVATVTLQRCFIDEDPTLTASWKDVDTYTSATEEQGLGGAKSYWRLGVKSGGWTSGSVTLRLTR